MTTYQAPKDIWAVNSSLHPNEPLDGDQDPRWVDTYGARGEASLKQIGQLLGVDLGKRRLQTPPARGYYLFCGHRGSGKSTELRNLRNQFHDANLYHVVFVDAAVDLDVHNLRYPDILLHLAAKLAEQLGAADCDIASIHLEPLYDWFTERIEKHEQTKQFAQESKGGMEAAPSVPFLAKVFGHISVAFKTNSSHKEELRFVLQNYFADFADAFNKFVTMAEEVLGQRLLFVVDGTDRLRGDDAAAFFGADVFQLQQVKGLFIYCAPIHLAYEGGQTNQDFDNVFHLPMVKVENEDGSPNDEGLQVMRQMLELRADSSLFDAGVADGLVRTSGGHPRELLRLLRYAFSHAENERFDAASANRAIGSLASDYRRFLNPEDYRILASIDAGREVHAEEASLRLNDLLYNLALLEYNNFYRRSHPVVRQTNEYKSAVSGLGRSEGAS